MKKRMVSLAACLAMSGTLMAGAASTVMASEGETVTFMGWYEEEMMAPVLEALNEKLEGKYSVEYTFVSSTDYNNVLSTQLAAGEGPDIVADGTGFTARIKAGNVVDISDREYISEFNEAGFILCSEDEKIYGIPSYGWFSGMWYNVDILNEAQVEIPKTLDEFIAACGAIEAAGYESLGLGLADDSPTNSMLMGYLENSFYHNNDANELGTDFDKAFAYGEVTMEGNINKYVAEWCKLIEEGYINAEMLGVSNEEALNNFIAGKSAFFYGGPWQYSNLKESGINFGMLPGLSATGENLYMLGDPGACFGINTNTKNMEGAEAVLEALASVEVQQAFVDANAGGFSYRSGVVADMPEEYANVKEIIEGGNISLPWDRWAVNMPAASLNDESVAQIQGLISGDITVDDYVAALDYKADSIRYE